MLPSTAKLRIWTLRIWGFRGPGLRSARQVLCGDASRLFLRHFSKHLGSVSWRTELCHGIPGPKNPKSSATKTTTWHCSMLVFSKQKRQKTGTDCEKLRQQHTTDLGSVRFLVRKGPLVETTILGCGDHTRNMFGTSLLKFYCKQTVVLETEERMQ